MWFRILLTLVTGVLFCTAAPGADYEFSWVERDSVVRVPDGAVWLYYYYWGGMERYKLSDLHNGQAHIELTDRTLADEVQPPSNTEAFLVVLEFPTNRWYRTAEIKPANFLRDFLPTLESLGKLEKTDGHSTKRLVLPEQVRHHLRFLTERAKPMAGEQIPVMIYVTNYNHCAVNMGLPLDVFITDANGWLVVPAPEVPLGLGVRHYVPDGHGFAGQMFAHAAELVVRKTNEVIELQESLPIEAWELRLVDQQGQPVSDVNLIEWIRIAGCGGNSGPLGITDRQGIVRVTLEPQALQHLAFQNGTSVQRDLSADELATLWREKKLTVTWSGQ